MRCCIACCILGWLGAADLTGVIAQHVAPDVAREKSGLERQPLVWEAEARNIGRACDVARAVALDVACLDPLRQKSGALWGIMGHRALTWRGIRLSNSVR